MRWPETSVDHSPLCASTAGSPGRRSSCRRRPTFCSCPVEVYASPHATALGAAAFARLGHEPGLALEDAVEPWSPAATYEPRIGADEAAERLAVQSAAVAATLRTGG